MPKRASDDLAESGKITKRKDFHGSYNYADFYNKEVEDFFRPRPIKWSRSYITRSGDIRHLKERGTIYSGTHWSSEEKEIFFEILARVSIHRVDLIKERLKHKSETEILEYYDLLQKNVDTISTSSFKHQLVKFKEIPLSFEMSQSFIDMEEKQAEALILYDKFRERSLTEKTRLEKLDSEHALINERVAEALTRQFYLKNRITNHAFELCRGDKCPQLVKSSYRMLEELVHLITADVMSKIVEQKMSAVWRRGEKMEEHIPVLPTDVYRAISRSHIGGLNRCTDFNLDPSLYFKKMPERLNLKLKRQRQNEKQRKAVSKADRYDVEKLYQDSLFGDPPSSELEPEVSSPGPSDKEEEGRLVPSKLLHLSQLSRVSSNRVNKDGECDDTSIDEEDLKQSREYEHVLLTWLATCSNPTLLAEDEAIAYLEDAAIRNAENVDDSSVEESSVEESSGIESSGEEAAEEELPVGIAVDDQLLEHDKGVGESSSDGFLSDSFSSGSCAE